MRATGFRARRGALAAALAAGLALAGCGYDPGTAGDQPDLSNVEAPTAEDPDYARQQAEHLLADAQALLPAVEHIQEHGAVTGETKSVAGELRGILEAQDGRLGDGGDGAAMITDEEVEAVTSAEGEEAANAFVELLRRQLPRLESSWSDLSEAGDAEVADVARDSAERLGALRPKVDALG
ncbi:hypothetical protein [uncultured Corynebacterium sp.]|uniref:hypothetical protein n=1 Tax=uncultured Corynebacterium sp. TaxID=159447 RepID=UPI0025FFDAA3|nr:hypothetical protein [uncultured Corynebacterium sp.]